MQCTCSAHAACAFSLATAKVLSGRRRWRCLAVFAAAATVLAVATALATTATALATNTAATTSTAAATQLGHFLLGHRLLGRDLLLSHLEEPVVLAVALLQVARLVRVGVRVRVRTRVRVRVGSRLGLGLGGTAAGGVPARLSVAAPPAPRG